LVNLYFSYLRHKRMQRCNFLSPSHFRPYQSKLMGFLLFRSRSLFLSVLKPSVLGASVVK
jgi:hypothetical protein